MNLKNKCFQKTESPFPGVKHFQVQNVQIFRVAYNSCSNILHFPTPGRCGFRWGMRQGIYPIQTWETQDRWVTEVQTRLEAGSSYRYLYKLGLITRPWTFHSQRKLNPWKNNGKSGRRLPFLWIHRIHVWYIYPHLVNVAKYTGILWVWYIFQGRSVRG